MSKGNTFENDFLKLIYNATAIANIADNAASSPLTNIYVALHTADPGEAGDQTTSEATYTGYARVAVARTSGGWTVTNNSVSPVANVDFPTRSDVGSQVLPFFSTGVAASGASKILHRGVIGSDQGPFTVVSAAGTGSAVEPITIPGHGFSVDDRVAFFPVGGSSLPGGITEGTVYWVTGITTNQIEVSDTQGGPAIDLSTAGDGRAFKVTPLTISQNSFPRLTTATVITED